MTIYRSTLHRVTFVMYSSDPLMASHSVPSVVGRVEGSQGSLAVADPADPRGELPGQTNHKLQQCFGYPLVN